MIRSPGGVFVASHISWSRDRDGNIVLMMEDEYRTVFATGTLLRDGALGMCGDLLDLLEQSEVEAMPVAGHA